MTAPLKVGGAWMSTREALAENLRMSEQQSKEAALERECKAHWREMYDLLAEALDAWDGDIVGLSPVFADVRKLLLTIESESA
jgi:hypothetical protein